VSCEDDPQVVQASIHRFFGIGHCHCKPSPSRTPILAFQILKSSNS
jgi:hypothetical protein